MPWIPELFSAPALAKIEDRLRREGLDTVPYFAGFLTGETNALVESFAGEPEVHYPVRGRVKGAQAFAAYAAATKAWLEEREASVEDVGVLRTKRRSVGEAVLHLGGDDGRTLFVVCADSYGGEDEAPTGTIRTLRVDVPHAGLP